jgi:hypothetical protein
MKQKLLLSALSICVLSFAGFTQNPNKLKINGVLHLTIMQNGSNITINSKPEEGEEDANSFEVNVNGNQVTLNTKPVDGKTTYTFNGQNLSEIEISGTSSLESKNTLQANSLTLNVNGVIEGPFAINCSALMVNSKGVSELILEGTATSLNINTNGVGVICAKNLICQNATVNSNGTGNVWVNASNNVNAKATGVSGIYYKVYREATPNIEALPKLNANSNQLGKIGVWRNTNNSCELSDNNVEINNNPKDIKNPRKPKEIKKEDLPNNSKDSEVEIKTINQAGDNDDKNDTEVSVKGNGQVEVKADGTTVNTGTNGVNVNTNGKSKTKVVATKAGNTQVKAGGTNVNANPNGKTKIKAGNTNINTNPNGKTTIKAGGTNIKVGGK